MNFDIDDLMDSDSDESFRTRAALMIAILAMLLAITGLGGSNAAEDAVNNNVLASDTWAFFQAKNIRQTDYEISVEELRLELVRDAETMTPELQSDIEALIANYEAKIARYDSEPDPDEPDNLMKGEGKTQLAAQATAYEEARDAAMRQDSNFDIAEALFQIAIVLGSVAIISRLRWMLWLALGLGCVGLGAMLNGFFLLFELPF